MHYHALARILGGYQTWTNISQAELVRDVLVPFVNRQLLPVGYDGAQAIMNLGMVTYLRIFRTPEHLPSTSTIQALTSREFAQYECTQEVLDGARLQYAWHEARSVLQATLAPLVHRVFVVMRIGDADLDSAYRNTMRPVIREFGYDALRIDEIQDSDDITAQILECIATSELVLCELSMERPNCYYEAGFAHALGRELILVIRRGETKHFDLASHRFIEWEAQEELAAGLRDRFGAIRARNTKEVQDQTKALTG